MTTTDGGGAGCGAGAYEPHPDRWRILAVTLVVGFMALLDVTIVNVAIPSIQVGLDTSPQVVQWVVSGYALTFGLTLVTGGRLGDAHGRRLMLLVGLGGFVVSSCAVGLAPTDDLVVVARLVQGASAGLLTPQNSGLIQELFRGAERGRAFGYFGATVGVASATGPLLGGAIIALAGAEEGWRYIFLVNVPIGLLAMVFVWRRVPGARALRPGGRGDPRIDLAGVLLLGATVLCVLVPLVDAMRGPSPLTFLVALSPLLALAFVRWERRVIARGAPPLLDVRLLARARGYAAGVALGTLYFTGFTGIFLVLSVFLQEEAGRTALETGMLLTPFALGAALTAPLAGRLVSRVGRRITVGAVGVMMSGVVVLAVALPDEPGAGGAWPFVVLPLLLAGIGGGGVISPNFALALSDVPPRMGGAAGAALQTGQRIGSALGAALLMTAYRLALETTDAVGAVRVALGCSVVLLCTALAVAVWDHRRRRLDA